MIKKTHGHECEQTLGDGEGQGSLACCSPWGSQRVGHDSKTEQYKTTSTQMLTQFNNKVIDPLLNRPKSLHDPDNHDGVITHLEPDTLEC